MKKPRPTLGMQPPRYHFFLNPQSEHRFTRCPQCGGPTRARKFALLIYLKKAGMVALGKTCRYCEKCEIIIAHQLEIEDLMADLFEQVGPRVIGSDYLVLGTVERAAWRTGKSEPMTVDDMLRHVADFKGYLDVTYDPGGWRPNRPARPPRRKK